MPTGTKVTNEEFIRRIKEKHGDKFSYEKTVYVNGKVKVTATCPIHGDFQKFPGHFLNDYGCQKCGRGTRTKDQFIADARELHGEKYNYSKVNYKDDDTEVVIVCPIHGDFEYKPKYHLDKRGEGGCKQCAVEKVKSVCTKTQEQFIDEAKQIHGEKYDYSKVDYKGTRTYVIIVCREHGPFEQTPACHLKSIGYSCSECEKIALRLNTEQFIAMAKKVHGNKYDYSMAIYEKSDIPITIICRTHGAFEQLPSVHSGNHGCPKCKADKHVETRRTTIEQFIAKSRKVHKDKYDYSRVVYVNNKTNVVIICPIHGKFKQAPQEHTNRGGGCPICSESKGERAVRCALESQGIFPHPQYRLKNGQRVDFAFRHNWKAFVIEYHGKQHYTPCSFGSKKKDPITMLYENIKRDVRKEKVLRNIQCLTIPFWEYGRIKEIVVSFLQGEQIVFADPPESVKNYETICEEYRRKLNESEKNQEYVKLSG